MVISVFKFFIPQCFLRCWLQGDNCPKEVRNSFVGKWCSLLTQAQYFKTATHAHLCKGHTHEDIGGGNQLWNFVLIAKLWQCNTFGKSLHSPVRWCFQHCYSSSTCMSWFTDPCRCDEVGQLEFWSHHLPIPANKAKVLDKKDDASFDENWCRVQDWARRYGFLAASWVHQAARAGSCVTKIHWVTLIGWTSG